MDISPFNRFHQQFKNQILKDKPSIDKRKILTQCLQEWSKLSDSKKVVYSFDDFDEMVCSVEDNGSVVIKQPWFHCKTCWPNESNKGCCIVCAKKCHKNHDLEYCGWCECYCDCALSGKCQCYHRETPKITETSPFSQPSFTIHKQNKHTEPLIHLPKGPGGWKPPANITLTNSTFIQPKISEDIKPIPGFSQINHMSYDIRADKVKPKKRSKNVFDPLFLRSLEEKEKEKNPKEQNQTEKETTPKAKKEEKQSNFIPNTKPKLQKLNEPTAEGNQLKFGQPIPMNFQNFNELTTEGNQLKFGQPIPMNFQNFNELTTDQGESLFVPKTQAKLHKLNEPTEGNQLKFGQKTTTNFKKLDEPTKEENQGKFVLKGKSGLAASKTQNPFKSNFSQKQSQQQSLPRPRKLGTLRQHQNHPSPFEQEETEETEFIDKVYTIEELRGLPLEELENIEHLLHKKQESKK